jgi:hypothetical protein
MHLRVGVRAPIDAAARTDASAGADIGVTASRSGQVEDAPVDLWASMTVKSGGRRAVATTRTINGQYDPRTGTGRLDIAVDRKRILTELLDFERGRGISLVCNSHENRCRTLVLRQSARMTVAATGTALVAEGNYSTATLDFAKILRAEQAVTTHMNVTAALAAPLKPERQATINLSYAFRW